ncbi:6,7-dimethyl-8-ribityllumazine synthase [Candidatus Woesearchaeota archaeon]|nr:6,7-dimethyl-8-ribityllumazine synthase [Candidatus Woesearchaeota archaeon]
MRTENKISIAIVVADFNKEITTEMLRIAETRAQEKNVSVVSVVHVPGVFDMPFAVKKLLQKNNIDGVVTLGVVLSGGTAHDAHIAENHARLCADLSVEFEKPVALSVIGHNVSKQQAIERYESYAKHGIDAIAELVTTFRTLDQKK